MKKPEQLGLKLGILLSLGALLALWYWRNLPCIPRTVTGVPCITCGLTRSWLAVFQLDFFTAFRQYPMFWSIPLIVLYFLYDGKLFPHPKVNTWILGCLITGIILIWLARILGFLGGLLPL